MIAACTETSSHEVTSSQMSTLGSAARARAMAMRWRSPPESCSGYRLSSEASSATWSSTLTMRASRSSRVVLKKISMGSSRIWRMVLRGFSELYGLWKMYWMSRRSSRERP